MNKIISTTTLQDIEDRLFRANMYKKLLFMRTELEAIQEMLDRFSEPQYLIKRLQQRIDNLNVEVYYNTEKNRFWR